MNKLVAQVAQALTPWNGMSGPSSQAHQTDFSSGVSDQQSVGSNPAWHCLVSLTIIDLSFGWEMKQYRSHVLCRAHKKNPVDPSPKCFWYGWLQIVHNKRVIQYSSPRHLERHASYICKELCFIPSCIAIFALIYKKAISLPCEEKNWRGKRCNNLTRISDLYYSGMQLPVKKKESFQRHNAHAERGSGNATGKETHNGTIENVEVYYAPRWIVNMY